MNTHHTIKLCDRCYWDTISETVALHHEIVPLTSNMKKLLKLLIANYNKPISSVDIFLHVWDSYEQEYTPRNVRNLISNLRKRLPCLNIVNYYGGSYMLKKNRESHPVFADHLIEILDQSKNGITISDPSQPDNPVIYINHAFANAFGYSPDEIIGKNCRFLQGDDRDQPALEELRKAMKEQTDVTVILRNYHKSGELIYNEVTISPVFDKKTHKLKYYIGVQKDVTSVQKLIQQIKGMI
ncbi:PAS sensor protein [Sulfuricurvum kujiense DSM 16994]|uniref:PAS sensor protein n=1 Tax=Sulfuricurvum kujiense (strain ATCC BAA-921 / DSM 16994 / JCM 11577 / YK-1) TaxID=709032 RepID=E4U0H9_SULKY|nr:helix-turn-helix domain-containing protein [Sulfuricurvum kujiense]ADR34296.1 PAS sensor protein [Sulfuricurvum kujiense DSM 16994]